MCELVSWASVFSFPFKELQSKTQVDYCCINVVPFIPLVCRVHVLKLNAVRAYKNFVSYQYIVIWIGLLTITLDDSVAYAFHIFLARLIELINQINYMLFVWMEKKCCAFFVIFILKICDAVIALLIHVIRK